MSCSVMYCHRPKEVERCNGTKCPYPHELIDVEYEPKNASDNEEKAE